MLERVVSRNTVQFDVDLYYSQKLAFACSKEKVTYLSDFWDFGVDGFLGRVVTTDELSERRKTNFSILNHAVAKEDAKNMQTVRADPGQTSLRSLRRLT